MAPPQAPVNNIGGGANVLCEQLTLWLNPEPSAQGPEDEFRTLTWRRFFGDFRSVTLRFAVKEYSEPCACQVQTGQRRTSISASIRQGLRAQQNQHR